MSPIIRGAVLVVALGLPASPPLAQALAQKPGSVTTQATARASLPNTAADVTLRIEARARTLADVQASLAANSSNLMAFLKTSGAEQTRTEGVGVEPEIDPNPVRGQPPRILGYAGHVAVSFQLEAGKLGTVLGEALGHGANNIERTSLRPRQTELDAKRRSLAVEATRLAMDDAGAVAEAAGRKLGAVQSLNVNSSFPSPTRSFGMLAAAPAPAMAMAAPVATEAGDTEVTASVTATVALIEP